VKNYRVDFRRPHDANPRRHAKVFTFTLAATEAGARRNILKAHPGSEILAVTEQPR